MVNYNYDFYPVADTRILFKDLIVAHKDEIKNYMRWENYNLNQINIPVVDLVKDHALTVLTKSYGLFHVEQDILDQLTADVFIHFPVLLQQLSITRLIDAYGVVKDDTDIVETTRTESLNTEVGQNSTITQGTSQADSTVLNTQQKTTGTVAVDATITNTQNSTTNIENSSGIESTGTRNVNLQHNMPEQALYGETGFFPVDLQGTPKLSTGYIQMAAEGFTTSNPISTTELSEQIIDGTNSSNNDSTTTNDLTVADTGTTTRTTTNSGSDTSEATTATTGLNEITETVKSTLTNKQYAYEIKTFLETADGIIAFKKWEDQFSWVIGIV